MKNNRNFYLLLLSVACLLSACCKGKNDRNYEISASDWEWFMTGEKQLAIYRDSATGQQDTLRYGEIETAFFDCEKANAGTWLNACYVTVCRQQATQNLHFQHNKGFNRVSEISKIRYLSFNTSSVFFELTNLVPENELVFGTQKVGSHLYSKESILPEPYELFANKEEGVLIYKYRDGMGAEYKWEKIN